MKPTLIACLVLGLSFLGHAQQPAPLPPLPPGPIPAPPEYAKWKVSIKLDSHAAGGAAATQDASTPGAAGMPGAVGTPGALGPKDKIRTITVTKTKNLRLIEIVDESGTKISCFCIDSTQYLMLGNDTWTGVSAAGGYTVPIYGGNDFPECGWVSRKNYIAVGQTSGHPCFIFSDQVQSLDPMVLKEMQTMALPGHPINPSQYVVGAMASIDMQTLLPVSVHKGNETYTYQYEAPPDEMLEIPPQLRQRIKVMDQRMKDLSRKPTAS